MGMNISIGERDSKDYVSEKLGSNNTILSWYNEIEKRKGTDKKFKYIYGSEEYTEDGCRIYKVEDLPKLLEELNEIYKLKIKGYYDVVKTFIRVCKIAIQRQLPIYASY